MKRKSKSKRDKGELKISHRSNFLDKDEFIYLFIICSVGLLLRLAYVFETKEMPFIQNLFSDSKIYHEWGEEIAKGDLIGQEAFFMAPFYPYFLAAIYLIFGHSIHLVRLIQVVISTFNIVLVYLIGRKIFSRRVGYIAALITSIYSVFIFYSGAILAETLQTFFASLLILSLTTAKKEKFENKWFVSGILLGVLAIFRANILLFFFGAVIWLLIQRKLNTVLREKFVKTIIYFTLGTAIPISMIVVRNFIVTHDLVILTSNGGINFYLGNNPNSPGVFVNPTEFDYYSDLSGQKYAEKILGRDLKPSEASNYWFERGLEFIINNPFDAAALTIKKLTMFIGENENPQSSIMDVDFARENYSKILRLPLINFLIVSIFGIAGIVLSLREKQKYSLHYLFIICYALGTIIFFVNGRFRIALVPLIIVFAAHGLSMSIEYIKSKNYNKLSTPAVTMLAAIAFNLFAVPKVNFNEYDAYLNLGDSFMEKKEYDKAIENYKKSLALRDFYLTNVHLGNAYAMRKDAQSALIFFQRAISQNPQYAPAYFNQGILYSEIGSWEGALASFNKVLALDNKFAEAYRNVAIIYYINEYWEKSLENFEKYLEFVKDEETRKNVMSDIEELRNKLKDGNINISN